MRPKTTLCRGAPVEEMRAYCGADRRREEIVGERPRGERGRVREGRGETMFELTQQHVDAMATDAYARHYVEKALARMDGESEDDSMFVPKEEDEFPFRHNGYSGDQW